MFGMKAFFLVGATVSGNVVTQSESPSTPILFSGCELHVQVLDTSIADAQAPVLGHSQYSSVSSFPIAYSITYSPNTLPIPYYSLSARITCSGVLRYISDTAVHITLGETGVNLADIPVRAV